MFSPNLLYACGALLVSMLLAVRFLSHRKAAVLFLAAAAVTAFESGLLTNFGLPLPSGLRLMLAGIKLQAIAAAAILAVNLLLGWIAFRLASGHEGQLHRA
ncbi:MAG TPA: hypothetical protein VIU29_05575 [Candidatus Deferrimicrobiaceae bacterium]